MYFCWYMDFTVFFKCYPTLLKSGDRTQEIIEWNKYQMLIFHASISLDKWDTWNNNNNNSNNNNINSIYNYKHYLLLLILQICIKFIFIKFITQMSLTVMWTIMYRNGYPHHTIILREVKLSLNWRWFTGLKQQHNM